MGGSTGGKGKQGQARAVGGAQRDLNPLVKANAELVKRFEAILTPQQVARYREMAFRHAVMEGLRDRLVLRKIAANDQQIDQLARLLDESVETYQQFAQMGAKELKILTPAQQAEVDLPSQTQ